MVLASGESEAVAPPPMGGRQAAKAGNCRLLLRRPAFEADIAS
jgi:hypothetical protein